MVINQLFINKPDYKILLGVANAFGIRDLTDFNSHFDAVTMNNIMTIERIKELEPLLASYYIPCKKDKFTTNLNYNKAITIFRQLLKTVGMTLLYKEHYRNGVKIKYYRLGRLQNDKLKDSSKYIITFE